MSADKLIPDNIKAWWKEAVVFQVWPHSFCDSNGDGIGDLPGIISKLDYLKDLGVNVVWLSPVYPSPFKDFGYDISDFKGINPVYGSLADWDRLKDECHKRGMKLMMDLVLNHCSDQHPWFIDTKSNKDSPYRDYFIWRDGRTGDVPEPNNWESIFTGPAWTYDEKTQQYYLHKYDSSQPDLDWENLTVRKELFDVVKFWLDRGCEGIRLDAISRISITPGLPDAPITNPKSRYQKADMHMKHGPKLHEYLRDLNKDVFSHYDTLVVGEMSSTGPEKALEYVHPRQNQLQMIFQFDQMFVDADRSDRLAIKSWTLPELKALYTKWQDMQSKQGGWTANYLSNHDQGRPVSRLGNDSPEWRSRSAKLLALLEVALPGTLYIYQGEELGVKNFPKDFTIDDLPDVQTQTYWKGKKAIGADMDEVMKRLQLRARDNGRLPIPWDSSQPNGGFSTVKPWAKMDTDDIGFAAANIQIKDPQSVRSFWKAAVAQRAKRPTWVYGIYQDIDPEHQQIFAYTLRPTHDADIAYLIILNWSEQVVKYQVPINVDKTTLVLSNVAEDRPHFKESTKSIELEGWEACVFEL